MISEMFFDNQNQDMKKAKRDALRAERRAAREKFFASLQGLTKEERQSKRQEWKESVLVAQTERKEEMIKRQIEKSMRQEAKKTRVMEKAKRREEKAGNNAETGSELVTSSNNKLAKEERASLRVANREARQAAHQASREARQNELKVARELFLESLAGLSPAEKQVKRKEWNEMRCVVRAARKELQAKRREERIKFTNLKRNHKGDFIMVLDVEDSVKAVGFAGNDTKAPAATNSKHQARQSERKAAKEKFLASLNGLSKEEKQTKRKAWKDSIRVAKNAIHQNKGPTGTTGLHVRGFKKAKSADLMNALEGLSIKEMKDNSNLSNLESLDASKEENEECLARESTWSKHNEMTAVADSEFELIGAKDTA